MFRRAKKQKIQIIDLPEQIFRKIFSYLHENDLHFNLKNTCNTIKQYVSGYVEWKNSFMLLFENDDGRLPIETVHVIQYTHKKPKFYTNVAHPKIPVGSTTHCNLRGENWLAFATTIHKKSVIGVYNGYGNQILSLYLFDFGKNELTRIRETRPGENESIPHKRTDVSPVGSVFYVSEIIWSPIGESTIVIFEISSWLAYHNFIQIICFHQNEENGSLTYSSYYSVPPKGLRTFERFRIVQKAKSEVLIVGGVERHQSATINQIIWSGILSNDNTRITWKDSGHRIPYYTTCSIVCFFMSDNIYIIEGPSHHYFLEFKTQRFCSRYDWEEKKYYFNVFPIPFQIYENLGTCGNILNIEENKKFEVTAIYTKTEYENNNKRQIWVFTENEGFHEASCFYTTSKMIKFFEEKCTKEKVSSNNKKFLRSFLKR